MGKYIKKNKSNTFYSWCIISKNEYLLDLWDYELNEDMPHDVTTGSAKKRYFKCPRGIHKSELYTINNITGPKHQKVDCRRCHSFGQWCVDSGNLDMLKRWNCELNKTSPFEVSFMSNKKYYFNCPYLHENHLPELKSLNNVVQQEGSRKCIGCESFAQWCIDNVDKDFMEKYWSNKNTENPFTILPTHTKKVWIKCQGKDYHDDYLIAPYNFKGGERCPYCSSKKIHYYDSLGYLVPNAVKMWSDKNNKSVFEIGPYSNKQAWFHCDIHGDYQQKICDYTKGDGVCKYCSADDNVSKLQKKVNDYIVNDLHYSCLHEYDCNIIPINPKTGCKLPFDNEIPFLNLIIEVHGSQHYKPDSIFNKMYAQEKNISEEDALKYQKWKDTYKKEFAISQGYYYLEIPYWTENKQYEYKTLIDNKIKEIL